MGTALAPRRRTTTTRRRIIGAGIGAATGVWAAPAVVQLAAAQAAESGAPAYPQVASIEGGAPDPGGPGFHAVWNLRAIVDWGPYLPGTAYWEAQQVALYDADGLTVVAVAPRDRYPYQAPVTCTAVLVLNEGQDNEEILRHSKTILLQVGRYTP